MTTHAWIVLVLVMMGGGRAFWRMVGRLLGVGHDDDWREYPWPPPKEDKRDG